MLQVQKNTKIMCAQVPFDKVYPVRFQESNKEKQKTEKVVKTKPKVIKPSEVIKSE
jgi:hypothetical protein